MAKADPGKVTEFVERVDKDTLFVRARLELKDGTLGDAGMTVRRGEDGFEGYESRLV